MARSYSAMARSHWPFSYQALPRLRHESADSVSDCARAYTTPTIIETLASNEKHWVTNAMRLVRAGFRLHTQEVGGKPVTCRKELQLGIDQWKAAQGRELRTVYPCTRPVSLISVKSSERTGAHPLLPHCDASGASGLVAAAHAARCQSRPCLVFDASLSKASIPLRADFTEIPSQPDDFFLQVFTQAETYWE